jgi:hypothetical protein
MGVRPGLKVMAGDDAVDALIRKRFSGCETRLLFPEDRRGFFEWPEVGEQLRLMDAAVMKEGGCPE